MSYLSSESQRPIADHALIGDLRGAALVDVDGGIAWLCLPRFDSAPLFFPLLDARQGGGCTIVPHEAIEQRTRRYLPATNILETTLSTGSGTLVVTDCMPLRAIADCGDTGPDCTAPGQVIRRISCSTGEVGLTLRVAPRFDWAREQIAPTLTANGALWPDSELSLACSHRLAADGDDVVCRLHLAQGETALLVLGHGASPTAADLGAAPRRIQETHDYWCAWSAQNTYHGRHEQMVLRSALCLKLLTYAPSGALIAAPTTSLPEAVGGERNWDYRYVWARDASFSISAFLNLGFRREAAEFLRFLHQADGLGSDEVLRVMYGVEGPLGDKEREQQLGHLAGWRDSRPVLAGNGASGQQQHEIYGELLAALNLYVSCHGLDGLCPDLRADMGQFVTRLADTAIERWRTPDQGIWELRGAARHLLHTKAMCWVALDRAVKLAPHVGHVCARSVPRWEKERDAIHADCLRHGWNEQLNTLTHLAGWRDSRPVLAGNGASDQQQHEIYGELLAALNLYVSQYGLDGLCPDLRADMGQFVTRLADTAIERWRTPDQGIWELRGAARHLLHTKAMCWVALDRAIKLAPHVGHVCARSVPRWEKEREAIHADCLRHGWNAHRNALVMEYGGADLDMSTLRLALMDFLPADDPRMAATLAASERDLDAGTGDLFYRYVFDDGLRGKEGAFAACTFWVAGVHTLAGNHRRAGQLVDSMLARANDLGLYAEQIDPASGAQLGNFPQGFTHMALIHEVVRAHAPASSPSSSPRKESP